MKKTTLFILFILCVCLHVQSQSTDTLTLATYTYATNNRIANLQPFADHLTRQAGFATRVISYPTVKAFVTGIQAKQVDIAFINTFGYLLLAEADKQTVSPVAALNVKKEASANYKTILLTHARSGINNLEELKESASDLTMMFVNEGSTSGNLVPRMLLSSLGISSPEHSFKKVVYGNTHAHTLLEVLAGKADIGTFGSDEYYKWLARNAAAKDQLRVLWVSEEIPLGPVLLKKSLAQTIQTSITQNLLSLSDLNPAALESIKNGWSEAKQSDKYIPVTDSYYNSFRNLTGNHKEVTEILNLYTK